MGRNERIRKEQRLEQELAEKAAIEQRRKEKTEPVYRVTKRLVIAVVATVLILYLGVIVTAKLPDILQRISQSMN